MKSHGKLFVGTFLILGLALSARAEVKAVVERNQGDQATPAFKFKNVPAPSTSDAAQKAKFEIVDGEKDDNGGDLDKLHDGALPTEEDQPAENFFFNQNTDGGRILIDLEKAIEIRQVNTYSWHPNTRGPQVYKLYGADGQASGFDARPKRPTDPEMAGWKLIASVDTRPKDGEPGGQYGVSIADPVGPIGKYRYLLFDIHQTETDDAFGNTFYSEIDVVSKSSEASKPALEGKQTLNFDGKYHVTIDYTQMPELAGWVKTKLAPVIEAWYPKLVAMLPGKGYEAPTQFSITFKSPGRGVAYTMGTRIVCAGGWFSKELDREAVGAILHEMVHVVQQYGLAGQHNPDAQVPGWLVEGIPDYIRWFLYEPQSHGADHIRNIDDAKYDAAYRTSANFLDYVTRKYDKNLVAKLNAALRDGKYNDDLWKADTGKTVQELADEWKAALKAGHGVALVESPAGAAAGAPAAADGSSDDQSANTLTDAEKQAGWKLLFDGKDTDGWHSFRKDTVLPGWQVKDGTLACVDPHHAGDLCTDDKYDWFELQLDYNISPAGNSGILYHVTDKARATWATGPEFQLEDNEKAADHIRCGWLYALYQPPIDPKTGKTLDATKPVGQWNHIRLLVTPEKCEHDINGVKYFEYVLHSDDFNQRVAKSKFHSMPDFAKSDIGYIALQGDHGQVAFRNIKIRPIEAPKP
jgi:hypothetical protein